MRTAGPLPALRLDAAAIRAIRDEVRRAGGREVCFLAEVTDDRRIANPRAVARGNRLAVLAAARDANEGEILLHNHPSGVLEPSEADLALAARAYAEGLGTAITDNEAEGLYVVVEPPAPRVRTPLDPHELDAVLAPDGPLSRLFPGYEDRPGQRAMLRVVADRYNEGGVAVVEAGTGTGKSLAYLLPAVVWAVRNRERTVVSTNTINLQEQLVGKDLPLLRRLLDEDFTWSLVKGRGNYVSIRRLLLAADSALSLFEGDRDAELDALRKWIERSEDGSLSDLPVAPSDDVWEEVRSDGEICLRTRCPHFQQCFYQRARRSASSADLLIANHALLFADVSVRRALDDWGQAAVLPPYRHVILDEGHNVEDAATSHLGAELTRTGLFRILSRLDRNGKGVLAAVEQLLAADDRAAEGPRLLERIRGVLRPAAAEAREAVQEFFTHLEPLVPNEGEEPLRLGRGDPRDPAHHDSLMELVDRVSGTFARLGREIEELRLRLEEDEPLRDRLEGRILDLGSIERRLASARASLALVLGPPGEREQFVRWIEGRGGEGGPLRNVLMAAAPIEPGPLLREGLFDRVDTAIVTSATLTTGPEGFRFIRGRLGLADADPPRAASRTFAEAADPPIPLAFADSDPSGSDLAAGSAGAPLQVVESTLGSPFDYGSQTILGVPTDLPDYRLGASYHEATARVAADFTRDIGGGVFLLFTSYHALRAVAARLRQMGIDGTVPLLVHGEAPRWRLLDDFVRAGNALLLGTASFWEGVDVPGEPLRGLILQKIPFRVPTEPIIQARTEVIERRGGSGFSQYHLPLAALRLRQGFGRLIRSREDRGAVLLLDDRILTARYGPRLRRALPDAPLVKGPWADVRRRVAAFYDEGR